MSINKPYNIEAVDQRGMVVKVQLWADSIEHSHRRFLLTFGPTFCVYHNYPSPFGGKISPPSTTLERLYPEELSRVIRTFAGFSPA